MQNEKVRVELYIYKKIGLVKKMVLQNIFGEGNKKIDQTKTKTMRVQLYIYKKWFGQKNGYFLLVDGQFCIFENI